MDLFGFRMDVWLYFANGTCVSYVACVRDSLRSSRHGQTGQQPGVYVLDMSDDARAPPPADTPRDPDHVLLTLMAPDSAIS